MLFPKWTGAPTMSIEFWFAVDAAISATAFSHSEIKNGWLKISPHVLDDMLNSGNRMSSAPFSTAFSAAEMMLAEFALQSPTVVCGITAAIFTNPCSML